MGFLKAQCPACWDNHDGMTCEQFQRQQAANYQAREITRRLETQNDLLRAQNNLLTQRRKR